MLTAGAKLGPYEILAAIGAGGMGEVYRARDTRLERTVAIKVMPEGLAADPQFRERFDREARTISQLMHPHICTLHDVGEHEGTSFLVMEYLEGETLADRLARGALKAADALTIATSICDALATAHRAGIVHRDVKPGNVMLTKSGAKLLDFGLAKASPVMSGGMSVVATAAAPVTAEGSILGTFQYMAPEQIEGREAGARSDIWALGCVIYEMLAGKRPFEAKTQAGLIGAILERDPDPTCLVEAQVPRRLTWIVTLCLRKDLEERWQNAGDVLHELRRLREDDGGGSAGGTAKRSRAALAAVLSAIAASLVMLGLLAWVRRAPTARENIRLVLLPAPGTEVNGGPAAPQAAVSPDGTRVVFSAIEANRRVRVYVRPLEALDPQPIAGTEDGELPFWSADGRYIAFFTGDRKLKKVALDGGPPQTICDLPGSGPWGGGTWNRDGVIVFGVGPGRPLYRVAAAGGARTALTTIDRARHELAQLWPSFLPDGRHFIFLTQSTDAGVRGIYLGALGSPHTSKLVDATVRAAVAPPDHLLFLRDGVLLTQSLDAEQGKLIGEAVPIADRIAYNPGFGLGRATFSVSDTGVLVYRAGGVGGIPIGQLTWYDRSGALISSIGAPAQYDAFDLTRDGRRIAASVYDARSRQLDIWLIDAANGGSARLTFDPSDDTAPTWSPDGRRVAFVSSRGGVQDLYLKQATGAASDQLVYQSPIDKIPMDWSADGRFIIFAASDPKTGADLWLLPLEGDRTPRPLIQTAANETAGQLSVDGRWLAYQSDESGVSHVYVQAFPPTGAKWQVSTDGGSQPRWRGDGRELFYLSADRKLMAVDVKPSSTFEVGPEKEVFRHPNVRFVTGVSAYTVTADGQRFLINSVVEQTGTTIIVVTNWLAALKR